MTRDKKTWFKSVFNRERLSLRRGGLRFMLSVSFTAAALILLIGLSALLTYRFDAATEKMQRETGERLLNQVNRNIDSLLRQTMRTADSLYYRVIKRYDMSQPEMEQAVKLIYETNNHFLSSVSLFSSQGRLLLSQPYASLKQGVVPTRREWFTEASQIIENVHFFKPQVQDLFTDTGSSYQWVIPVSSSVEMTQHGRVSQGVLLLSFKYSTITQALRNVDLREKGYIYLTDAHGQLIYHPRLQLINGGYGEEKTLSYCDRPDDTYRDDSGHQLVTVNTIGYTGWKLVLVNPLNTTMSGVGEVRAFTFLFILLAAAFIILINYIISTRIARPIKALEHQVAAYERGEPQTFDDGPPAPPEIEHLALAIDSLVRQQEELRKDILVEQEAKRRSELEALQAQIHPHFLYNTLDSIVWMIENERYSGAVEMVTALARFFRLSLAKGNSVTSIANELEQVRYYLTIQKVRFRNQFDYFISLDPNIADCLTIKLIVQPLVENAIYHGTSELGEEGEIHVSAYAKGPLIYIDVRDNGLGMTEEQVEALLQRKPMAIQGSKGSGIGVANVAERIRLFFGEEYGLTIHSKPDEGTLIRIRIPQRRASEEPGSASQAEALLTRKKEDEQHD